MKRSFYQGKVVVVTGASSGIGKAIAIDLAHRGATVVLGARREEKLKEVVDAIEHSGGEAVYYVMDVTKESDCEKFIDFAIAQFGKLDILICNAGISMPANFEEVEMEVLHRLMNVNFWGVTYCTKYALPYLLESKGNLVGVSSVAGIHGLPGRTGYSASKYALVGFLETIRIENLKKQLHVMIAVPGFTASNIRFTALTADGSEQGYTPRNEDKMMTSERAATLIANGIQRKKRYLYMDFEGKAVAFIKKFSTKWLDKIFYKTMAKEENAPLK